MTRAQLDERTLVDRITAQRWYGSKGREVASARILDSAEPPGFTLSLVEVRYRDGTHEIYQLLPDPVPAHELVHLIRAGESHPADEGTVEFHQAGGFDLDRELGPARPIGTEQSNSSVVLGEELILKAYRRLEPGVNPELEMLRFLGRRGFRNVPPLGGWYAYVGRPLEATLGIVQEYTRDGLDGWELALDELAGEPDRFLGRLWRLGQVTGELHTVLASDSDDPSFCPQEPSLESLELQTARIDEEIERVFFELPTDIEALAPIRDRGDEIRERLRGLTHIATTGRSIRHHGDFHLGQTLLAEDWMILDFEGEPARSLPERRAKRSPLRDVAGMLRSFAYAASAVEQLRGRTAPPSWEERARSEFLEGYLDTVDQEIVPAGREMFDKLLAVFELEKAVYELRYELSMRPDWLPIPVAGIVRMLES